MQPINPSGSTLKPKEPARRRSSMRYWPKLKPSAVSHDGASLSLHSYVQIRYRNYPGTLILARFDSLICDVQNPSTMSMIQTPRVHLLPIHQCHALNLPLKCHFRRTSSRQRATARSTISTPNHKDKDPPSSIPTLLNRSSMPALNRPHRHLRGHSIGITVAIGRTMSGSTKCTETTMSISQCRTPSHRTTETMWC